MSITTTEWCQHSSHFVHSDKITWLYLEGGGRRRICEDCKAIVEAAKKNVKKLLTEEKKSSKNNISLASKPKGECY